MAAIVANCAISLNCELTQPVKVQYIDGNMFSMDNAGNTAHVYVFYNGEPQEIVGSVSADVIRSDGTTVAITGAMSGNRAYVIFPQSCYAIPGVVSVVIKVTEGTTVTTIAAFVANVYRSSTDTIVDPGTIIPSVQNLISAIETAVASIPADYSSLWESLAPDYTNITFPVTAGKYCTYNGTLYVAKVDIATTESFTAAHWQSTNIGDNLSALKSAITENKTYADWESGGLNPANGGNTTNAARIRLTKYVGINNNIPFALALTGYEFSIFAWNYSTGAYVGMYTTGNVFATSGTAKWVGSFDFAAYPGYKFRVVLRNAVTTTASISTSEATNCVFTVNRFDTDETLTKEHVAADAKKTGEVKSDVENLKNVNDFDLVNEKTTKTGTSGNVTFTWSGKVCNVDGTSTAQSASRNNVWEYTNGFPVGVKPGSAMFVEILQGGNDNIFVGLIWLKSDTSKEYVYYNASALVTVPSDAVGVTIGIAVKGGQTVTNTDFEYHVISMGYDYKIARNDIEEIEDAVADYLPSNVLKEFGKFTSGTSRGVTFTWDSNHISCLVDGEVEGDIAAYNNLWIYTDGFPGQIAPGKDYRLDFESTSESDVGVSIYYLLDNGDGTTTVDRTHRYTNSSEFSVPSNAIGITIRLDVLTGTDVDNVTVNIKILNSVQEISSGNSIAKMLCVGSSFLIGAIYPGGVYDHQCSFENSPWGNVAIGLGISNKNAQLIKMSSTGILASGSSGNILTKIKSLDLSGFDYVLTQFNIPDLGWTSGSGYPLGDLTSEAGDGSIVGAFLELLAYMKTSNPNATLIVVGAPPSNASEAASGENVFTYTYGNGKSIGEADLMMHRLAVREHFIFIDWEDLNLSYYYRDLCYGSNLHPEDDATCRAMGLYLARNCNYGTSLARVLKADIQR